MISRQDHERVIDLPDPALEVEGNLTRLTQALSNLLNNAAKYTEAGGRISVAVTCSNPERVEIRVKDSGLGISAELLPRLFNLFTQADATTHCAQGGLGIGLALVRKLVEMHGGTVAAYSQGTNCGGEFVMRLPLLARNPQHRSPVSAATERERRTISRRVLVADDNPDSLESLAVLLRCDGHVAYTACDGEQALEQAARHRPAIALLNIGMPKLDGVQVGCKIRAENWGRAMTLIALTGWGQDSDRQRTRASGFDAHLVKPLDISELSAYLQLPDERVAGLEVSGLPTRGRVNPAVTERCRVFLNGALCGSPPRFAMLQPPAVLAFLGRLCNFAIQSYTACRARPHAPKAGAFL